MPAVIYTIGHSNHPMDEFIGLLTRHAVSAVADVRSHPKSRFSPQFDRKQLEAALKASGIRYGFLGRELGARPEAMECYQSGRVQYDRLADTPLFQKGVSDVVRSAEIYRIALLCAEKDPLVCHRAILVCRHLDSRGVEVRHILADGELETHNQALDRLLKELHLAQPDLFRTRREIIDEAYDLRGRQIAYSERELVR